MVGARVRRQQVAYAKTRGLSSRRACALLSVARSGLGYVSWYAALRGLTATRAAVLQLSVPVIAAAGGVVFLTEPISVRLVVSAMLVIGGTALTLARRGPESSRR